jgi:hypothetical protein
MAIKKEEATANFLLGTYLLLLVSILMRPRMRLKRNLIFFVRDESKKSGCE